MKPMTAVYCYLFPEIRPLLRQVESAFPDNAYLVTEPAANVNAALKGLFNPDITLPSTADGAVSLDEMHHPVIERIVSQYSPHVLGIGEFPFAYPTPGSSEGIFKRLARLRSDGIDRIAVLDGEYEGYEAYAKDLGILVEKYPALNPKIPPRNWFISNPSARDGNIIQNQDINALCDAGHKVMLDLAYVGSTAPYAFDARHPNIDTLFLSLSKPYGLFRFRVGFSFSREEQPSLYGNKWFKDPVRLLQGLKAVESYPPCSLAGKYHSAQQYGIERLAEDGIAAQPSDVVLLANARRSDGEIPGMERYLRGEKYRFCLTPYLEERERGLTK